MDNIELNMTRSELANPNESPEVSDLLKKLKEEGEASRSFGTDIIDLQTMKMTGMLVNKDILTWDDVAQRLQLLADAAQDKADKQRV